METILKLMQVGVTYGGKPALSEVTLDIPEHRITAIIGPSGCGKTTLLRTVNRMLDEQPGAAFSGRILLNDRDTASIPREELRRRVGLVFQTPAPFPFSIEQNMTYAPRYYGVRDKAELRRITQEKLELAGLYEEVRSELGKSALQLSGGQQQRLCIARALTVEPDVLMLDEPCSALDVKSTAVIEDLLTKLKKRYTIVMVTHNMAQARRISDGVAFLYNGRLIEYGEKEQFFTAPRQPETQEFLQGIYG